MIWLSLRQHRSGVVGAAVVLLLVAAALTVLAAQTVQAPRDNMTGGLAATDPQSLWTPMWFTLLLLPALAGIFLGAPLLAGDLERGTHRLVWTQGLTRGRWLRDKLGITFGGVLIGAAVLGVVAQRTIPIQWSTGPRWVSASQWSNFDQLGLALPVYLVFAVALGVAVGALLGRTLLAMVITGGVYLALRAAVATFLRPNYLPPLHGGLPSPVGAWDINVSAPASGAPVLTYQPADRFWEFQGIEAAIFLVIAAALVVLTVVWVLRRDA
jgi:hypothetical protein